MPTQYNNTHKITTHTRQLQQYTRSTNNSYIKDNLKLATKHPRQIRILQHVQKVKTPKQESTVYTQHWVFVMLVLLTAGRTSMTPDDGQ